MIFIGSFLLMVINSCKTTQSLSAGNRIDSSLVFSPEGQYASLRIPSLVITKKGTLLAFAEGRIGTASDWSEMDLLLKRSEDGGNTWGSAVIIAAKKKGPTSNATPIIGNDGTIHLLYQRDYANAYYTFSKDDGKTWSEHTDITYAFDAFKPEYDWKVLAPGPGHSIQLKNGRLVVPVWLSDPNKLVPHRSHGPSCVATIYSDDQGKTWKRGDIVANNSPELKDPNESMAVQLDDGRVMLHMRTPDAKRLKAVSYSPDGATNWTKPVFDEELFEPVCMSSLIKVPARKKSGTSILLFSNPDSRSIPKNPRKNLTVKLSYDQGQSWPVQKVLNEGPSGYSDMAVGPDGTVYCLYETNTVGTGWNYSLMLKKFHLDMLTKSKSR
ncbi:exo-alpha-sialidase [Flavihumibacter sp. R14]|nr:exo-alpha-sialidase [Flavihumibacter soli]